MQEIVSIERLAGSWNAILREDNKPFYPLEILESQIPWFNALKNVIEQLQAQAAWFARSGNKKHKTAGGKSGEELLRSWNSEDEFLSVAEMAELINYLLARGN